MPSAGEVLGASCGLENFMITDVTSPATPASTEATHAMNPQFRALPFENAMALQEGGVRLTRRCG
jgi:hypothetical protein